MRESDVEVVLPGQLGRGGVNDVVVLVPMPPVLVPAPAVRIEALHPALQSQVGHNTSRKYANQHEALGTAVRTTWHGTVSRHGTVEEPGEERRHKSKKISNCTSAVSRLRLKATWFDTCSRPMLGQWPRNRNWVTVCWFPSR